MNAKNLVPVLSCALLFIFSSCQKDLIVPEEPTTLAVISSDASADDVVETAAPIHTAIVTNVNSNCAGYMEALPARYSLTSKKYPLILFIHGIGELGTGVTRLTCCGLPRHLNNKTFPASFNVGGVNYSFIVVSPQFKVRPSAADVQSVIDYAKNKYRIDETRIYVAGLSMGGGSTFDYSAVYGQNAAAIVPVCGGTAPTQALAKSVASKNLPIWAIYSYGDAVVPAQWGKDWINWIDAANPSIASETTLTIYSKEDHNSTWWKAFDPTTKENGMNVYEWMLRYKRGSAPAPIPNNPSDPESKPSGTLPTAVGGGDRTIAYSSTATVLLNGTLSKAVSPAWLKSYTWKQVSGPASTLEDFKLGQVYAKNFSGAGTYTYRLTVTDNNNVSATDDVVITITGTGGSTTPPANPNAPIADAGADRSITYSSTAYALLNGTLSRAVSPAWLKSYTWAQVSGPASTLEDFKLGQVYAKNFSGAGTYIYRLTVTDNNNVMTTDDVVITVTGTGGSSTPPVNPKAPIADAGADRTIDLSWGQVLLNSTLSKSVSPAWLQTYTWAQVSGPATASLTYVKLGQYTASVTKPGTYVFRTTVTDNTGLSSSDDMVVTVLNK